MTKRAGYLTKLAAHAGVTLSRRPKPRIQPEQRVTALSAAATPSPGAVHPLVADTGVPAAGHHRLFWLLQVVGWGGVSLLSVCTLFDVLGIHAAVVVALLRFVSGVAVTCGLRLLYRRLLWRGWSLWRLALGCSLLCLALGAAESSATYRLALALLSERAPLELQSFMHLVSMLLRSSAFLIWSLLYFNIKLQLDSSDARLRAACSEASARTSELRQLRAQVNPHFLFNALNSILAEKDHPAAVESITQELAEYLRFSLRPGGDFHLLGEELDALERYLRLEKTRFEERFVYAIEATPAARGVRVSFATVQPLLENALKYGRQTSPLPLHVRIAASCEDGFLRLTIANTGRWLEFDPVRSHGIGLANLRRRLELLSGGRARLTTAAVAGWVNIEVSLPVENNPFLA